MPEIQVRAQTFALRDPFGISRGKRSEVTNLILGVAGGLGEAAPIYYHGQNVAEMESLLRELTLPEGPLEPGQGPWRILEDPRLTTQSALRAALDMALLDAWGKSLGRRLCDLWDLDAERIPISSFTLGLDRPEVMAEKARRAPRTPILKVKLGGPQDMDCLEAIRGATDARLRVDANEGWTLREALEWCERLVDLDVDLIEQPLHRDMHGEGRELRDRNRSGIPIILDESVQCYEDIERTASEGDGINIKLAKCGGPSEAKRMAERARDLGLKVLVGCMLESSLGVTAAAHVGPLADFTDLDGAELLAEDPFDGVRFVDGRLELPDRPGLGVVEGPE